MKTTKTNLKNVDAKIENLKKRFKEQKIEKVDVVLTLQNVQRHVNEYKQKRNIQRDLRKDCELINENLKKDKNYIENKNKNLQIEIKELKKTQILKTRVNFSKKRYNFKRS